MVEFNPKRFVDSAVDVIRNRVGHEKVVAACSGGVDSTVTAILVYEATKNLASYFIDSGLMRTHDYEDARRNLGKFGIDLNYEDYSERFLEGLARKTSPESKRKVVRYVFYYECLPELMKRELARYLAQGTIKPDIDETRAGIKTQHNVLEQIGLDYDFELIEPLVDLYKGDVRKIARYFGLYEIAERQPFPGPGLATRIEGEVTREKLELLRKAHDIVAEIVRGYNLSAFQTFPVLLRSKVTGIEDGKRDFRNFMLLRSVDSEDAVTATVTEIPYHIHREIADRLTEELPVYVAYDITSKPPRTIEII